MSRKIFLSLALASSFVLATEAEDHLHKAQEAIIGKKLPKDTSSPSKEEMMLKNIDETLQRIKDKQRFDKAEWDNQIKNDYNEWMMKWTKRDERNIAKGFTLYPKDKAKRDRYNQVSANEAAYCIARDNLVSRYGYSSLDSNPQKAEILPYRENIEKLCFKFKKEQRALKEEIEDEKIADKK